MGKVENLLNRFCFLALDSGSMGVQPTTSTLNPGDVADVLAGLLLNDVLSGLSEVVFDLSRVETIAPNWTLVLAMLIDFARKAGMPCRVIGMQAQPAAAAAMYRMNKELRGLISAKAA